MTDTAGRGDPVTSLETLGKLIGVMTGALLVLSVGYDYGYLSSIGLTFAGVPTTITDHVRTAIVWAPANGVGIALGFLFGTIGDFRPPPTDTRAGRQVRWFFVLAYVVPMSLLMLMISTIFQALLFGMLALTLVGMILRGSSALNDMLGRGAAGALFMLPPLLFSTTFAGSLQGPLLFSGNDRFSATIKVDSSFVELKGVGVRRFGAFALFGEKNRTLHVVPESAIVRVQKESADQKALRCYVWSKLCPEPTPAASAPVASTAPAATAAPVSAPAAPKSR